MTEKIRFYIGDGYRIDNGVLYRYVYGRGYEKSAYQVGAIGVLVGVEYVGPKRRGMVGGEDFYMVFDEESVEYGIPGNMNPEIRRLHGWRGTTDGYHKAAYGRREVLGIEEGELGMYVTVGPDLAPEEA